MEALRAAVQNGADAVYLGCGQFNARQNAKNFTPQMLTEAVKYCHVRGVQVHLTPGLTPSRDNVFYYSLGRTMEDRKSVV